jgi:hypothetical protein
MSELVNNDQMNMILNIIYLLISFAIGRLTLQPGYQKVKGVLNNAKGLMDEVSEALLDDKISEEEFRKIVDRLHVLIDTGKLSPKTQVI